MATALSETDTLRSPNFRSHTVTTRGAHHCWPQAHRAFRAIRVDRKILLPTPQLHAPVSKQACLTNALCDGGDMGNRCSLKTQPVDGGEPSAAHGRLRTTPAMASFVGTLDRAEKEVEIKSGHPKGKEVRG